MREKGVDELFAAMRSLRAAGQSCVLHVVGDTEEDYRARLHEGEEAGWLVYHGYQHRRATLYRRGALPGSAVLP